MKENPAMERYRQSLPAWYEGIKKKAASKIAKLSLVRECAHGDESALRTLILNFWPFVNEFPDQIHRASVKMMRARHLKRFSIEDLEALWELSSNLLKGMQDDETTHRDLWVGAASALGISYTELSTQVAGTEMLELLQLTGEKIDQFVTLMRFVTVEIVAEALSRTVLAEEPFRNRVGVGIKWFEIHADHPGAISHEELALRLAEVRHGFGVFVFFRAGN